MYRQRRYQTSWYDKSGIQFSNAIQFYHNNLGGDKIDELVNTGMPLAIGVLFGISLVLLFVYFTYTKLRGVRFVVLNVDYANLCATMGALFSVYLLLCIYYTTSVSVHQECYASAARGARP